MDLNARVDATFEQTDGLTENRTPILHLANDKNCIFGAMYHFPDNVLTTFCQLSAH